MTHRKLVRTVCLAAALLIAGNVAWSAPQDKPGYTTTEFNAYMAAKSAKTPADKIALLDAFVSNFPMSSLVPFAYHDFFDIYYQQKNYPKSIEYVDKLLSMGPIKLHGAFHDTFDPNAPLLPWLLNYAQAFLMGCDQSELRTPEAYTAARDYAVQGQQELSRLQKPSAMMTDDQLVFMKKNVGMAFDSARQIAESGLNGDKSTCTVPPVTAPSEEELQKQEKERSETYDRLIEKLKRDAPSIQYSPSSR
jgi:hypothetical protein